MIILAEEIILEEGAIEGAGVRDAIRTMEEESLKEPGCLAYAFSIDITDPTLMRIYERWESTEALEAHFKTSHMAAFQQALGDIKPKSMDVKVYQIEKELDFENLQ